MDSGNSGSLQSSSGGDEEYDSRAEAINPFLHPSASTVGASLRNNLPPPPPPPPPTSSVFDSLPYLDAFRRSPAPNPNPPLNLDSLWADPNCTSVTSLAAPSSSQQAWLHAQLAPVQAPEQPPATPRSSKKRSRASRRAPTTVLTTNTTNFRAMVQEFTGIPAPPFASSSPFARSRLDYFHTAAASSSRSALLSADHSAPPPPYLLRPFPHKVPVPPFAPIYSSSSSSSTSVIDAIVSSTTATNSSSTANAHARTSISFSANPTCSINYQVPSDTGLGSPQQTLLSMQNPMFTFQSLLQSPLSMPAMPAFVSKPQATPITSSTSDLGTQLGDLQSLVGTSGTHSRLAEGPGQEEGGGRAQLRQRGGSCKLNYSASAQPDFHAEKGSDSAPARGEGIVDSWICSSD